MRYDDMIATVLAQPRADDVARVAAWRQFVDLFAQRRDQGDPGLTERAYHVLIDCRTAVPREVRAEMARALTGRLIPARLLAAFANENIADVAPLFSQAKLFPQDWLAILPSLPPPVRVVLRGRRDLDETVQRALEAYGSMDMMLAAPDTAVVEDVDTPSEPPAAQDSAQDNVQIRDLLSRIEAFRRTREAPAAEVVTPGEEVVSEPVEDFQGDRDFRWETDAQGVVTWVSGIAREPMIGRVIAVTDIGSVSGVDAQVTGAFARRAPFRDARLILPGGGTAAGEWRISGVPYFDPRDGRFNGFRGTGRRPRLDESARLPHSGSGLAGPPRESGLYGTGLSPDTLQNMAHELRTPLNAIVGFAQMIEGQILGPAASGYRDRAASILSEADRLLGALDDLDAAARLETRRFELHPARIETGAVIGEIIASYRAFATKRGVELTGVIAPDLPGIEADRDAIERLVGRLFAAIVGVAAVGERVDYGAVREEGGHALRLFITRPRSILALDERALLDPALEVAGEGDDAPRLGLGFGLRLVRQLAHALGGSLAIESGRFTLTLPVQSAAAGNQDRIG